MKLYATVKRQNIHFTTKFHLIISGNNKIMLFEQNNPQLHVHCVAIGIDHTMCLKV